MPLRILESVAQFFLAHALNTSEAEVSGIPARAGPRPITRWAKRS